MRNLSKATPMPQEICCRNWPKLFEYIEYTKDLPSGLYGRDAVERALDGIIDNPEYLVQDPVQGDLSYPLKEKYLKDQRYWISNKCSVAFFANVAQAIGGYRPLFHAGIICSYNMLLDIQPKHFQVLRLFPISLLIKYAKVFNKFFNKTKNPQRGEFKKGFVRVNLNYLSAYKKEITKHVCDWNAGFYSGFGKFTGSYDIQVNEIQCCTEGSPDCIFELTWRHTSLWRKALIFLHSLLDPGFIVGRDMDNLNLNDKLQRHEGILKDTTEELEKAHQTILEKEKFLTESHVAGGMAHEIRNSLGAAQLRIKRILDGEHANKNYRQLMAILAKLKDIPDIAEADLIDLVKALRVIHTNQKLYEENAAEIKKAIDRGLQVTKRVMAYSKLEAGQDGRQADLNQVVHELISTYAADFNQHNITIIPKLETHLQVHGSQSFIHSLLQNLLLNARDAIIEKATGQGTIEIAGRNDPEEIIFEISDDGVGIPQIDIPKIFQPFFTTKPSAGMGLGLNECQKIIKGYGGRIEVQSIPATGTKVTCVFCKPQKNPTE